MIQDVKERLLSPQVGPDLTRPELRWSDHTSVAVIVAVVVGLGLGALVALGEGVLLVFGALLIGLVIASARTPWAATLAIAPALLIPVDALAVRHLGSIPLSLAMGSFSIVVVVVTLLLRGRIASISPAAAIAVAALCGGAMLGYLRSGHELTASITLILAWVGAFLAGALLVRERKDLECLLVLMVPLALLAVYEALTGENPYLNLLPPVQFSGEQLTGLHRSFATFGTPIVAGSVFAICTCLGLGLWNRRVGLITALIAVGAVLTVSRSALLGLLAGVLVLFFLRRRSRLKVIAISFVTLLVAGLLLAQLPLFRESVTNRFNGKGRQDVVRANGLARVESDLGSRPLTLLLGNGLRHTQTELAAEGGNEGLSTLDDQYITLIYDVGLLPLGVAIFAILIAVKNSSESRRRIFLPALAASAVVLLFFDALYWSASAALIWFVFGAASSREAEGRDQRHG